MSKHGHLMLPGAFPDKVTPYIDFEDQAVVQCDVPVVKILTFSNTAGFHLDGISMGIDVIIFNCACSFEVISLKATCLLRI